MAILENRVKNYKPPKKKLFKVNNLTLSNFLNFLSLSAVLIMILNVKFVSVQMVVTDYAGYITQHYLNPIKNNAILALNASSNIFKIKTLYRENLELKIENEKLKTKAQKANRLEDENNKIKSSFQIASKNKNIVARSELILKPNSNSMDTAIISGGSKNQIKNNHIVISNGNLLGRIVTAGKNYSRVLLVNSYKSRIPVKTSLSGLLSILIGQGDNIGYLSNVNSRQKPKEGELVLTSGNGEYYPQNIPVGFISNVNGKNIEVTFITNLSYANFVEVIDPSKL